MLPSSPARALDIFYFIFAKYAFDEQHPSRRCSPLGLYYAMLTGAVLRVCCCRSCIPDSPDAGKASKMRKMSERASTTTSVAPGVGKRKALSFSSAMGMPAEGEQIVEALAQ